MSVILSQIRQCIQDFDFQHLFIDELGWDRHSMQIQNSTQVFMSQPKNSTAVSRRVMHSPTKNKVRKERMANQPDDANQTEVTDYEEEIPILLLSGDVVRAFAVLLVDATERSIEQRRKAA